MEMLLIDRDTAALVDVLDEWEGLSFVRDLWRPGEIRFQVRASARGASNLEKGRIVVPDRDASATAYMIEMIERKVGAEGVADDTLEVSGRALTLWLGERICVPAAGQAYDEQTAVVAETAIKHYVDGNMGPSAAAARQVPNLAVVATGGAGSAVTVAARYQYVQDIAEQIGRPQGIGWEITLDLAGAAFDFDTVVGVDRSATVFFDTAFDSVDRQTWLSSDVGRKTFAYVAGQGEGVMRDVVTRPSVAPTGFDRREAFVDARDIELGETAQLNVRGDAAISKSGNPDRYAVQVAQFGSFRYRTDWDLGDIVTVRRERWAAEVAAQIVRVTIAYDKPSVIPSRIDVEIAAAMPDILAVLQGIGGPGLADTADRAPGTPPGAIVMYGAGAAPAGWLLCDGSSVATATYPALFAIIGYTFGGAGANFNLPDLRGRFPLGVDGSHALGTAAGSLDHTHTTPAHTHPFTQPSGHSNHVFTQPSGHSAHTFTQPSAHTVTQPSAHGNHAHLLPFQASASTILRRIATATFGSGGSSTAAISQVTMTADTTSAVLLLSDTENTSLTHSGTAVSAHAGGAVDAHSAHSGGAVDAHSAHSGGAVDAHSAHAGGSVDSGGGSTSGTGNPAYRALHFIIKT